jgi:hypothetical protein
MGRGEQKPGREKIRPGGAGLLQKTEKEKCDNFKSGLDQKGIQNTEVRSQYGEIHSEF